jgi:hypothetical protein
MSTALERRNYTRSLASARSAKELYELARIAATSTSDVVRGESLRLFRMADEFRENAQELLERSGNARNEIL